MNRYYCPNCLSVDYNLVHAHDIAEDIITCACGKTSELTELVTYKDLREVKKAFLLKGQPDAIPYRFHMVRRWDFSEEDIRDYAYQGKAIQGGIR